MITSNSWILSKQKSCHRLVQTIIWLVSFTLGSCATEIVSSTDRVRYTQACSTSHAHTHAQSNLTGTNIANLAVRVWMVWNPAFLLTFICVQRAYVQRRATRIVSWMDSGMSSQSFTKLHQSQLVILKILRLFFCTHCRFITIYKNTFWVTAITVPY